MILKDVLELVNTSQAIRIINDDSGEEFYPTYHKINEYESYMVKDMRSKNNDLEIVISSLPF
ncbi:hypothetical protein [Clostridium sp.]|uniref:hypothetical protein n=1 Tax=Clostridium sp. TaxID=1506 RepID=UPI003217F8C2